MSGGGGTHSLTPVRSGFTLAEVLITLGIIGIVAAVTMPSLIAEYREKQTVVQLQRVYSMLSQALQSAIQDSDEVNYWCNGDPVPDYEQCSLIIADKFAQQLKVVKRCKVNDKTCYPNSGKGWNPLHNGTWHIPQIKTVYYDDANFVLADGTIMTIQAVGHDEGAGWCANGQPASLNSNWSSYYGKCGIIYVDINGLKGPNTYGKDLFDFKIFRNAIQPTGLKVDTINANSFLYQCAVGKGSDCSGWVLMNKNLDYLHCPDKLGWDKASSCKD